MRNQQVTRSLIILCIVFPISCILHKTSPGDCEISPVNDNPDQIQQYRKTTFNGSENEGTAQCQTLCCQHMECHGYHSKRIDRNSFTCILFKCNTLPCRLQRGYKESSNGYSFVRQQYLNHETTPRTTNGGTATPVSTKQTDTTATTVTTTTGKQPLSSESSLLPLTQTGKSTSPSTQSETSGQTATAASASTSKPDNTEFTRSKSSGPPIGTTTEPTNDLPEKDLTMVMVGIIIGLVVLIVCVLVPIVVLVVIRRNKKAVDPKSGLHNKGSGSGKTSKGSTSGTTTKQSGKGSVVAAKKPGTKPSKLAAFCCRGRKNKGQVTTTGTNSKLPAGSSPKCAGKYTTSSRPRKKNDFNSFIDVNVVTPTHKKGEESGELSGDNEKKQKRKPSSGTQGTQESDDDNGKKDERGKRAIKNEAKGKRTAKKNQKQNRTKQKHRKSEDDTTENTQRENGSGHSNSKRTGKRPAKREGKSKKPPKVTVTRTQTKRVE